MSSPDINYPAQPSYGEGMAEALKAQAEFLKGTGDFADVGSLESLLPLEKSIREKTAQADTDILRKTLLGTTGTYDEQGRLVIGHESSDSGERFTVKQIKPGQGKTQPVWAVVDSLGSVQKEWGGNYVGGAVTGKHDQERRYILEAIAEADKLSGAGTGESTPIYAKDASGNVITDSSKVGQVGYAGTGMVDILGDTRDMTRYETRTATQEDVDAGLAEEVGDSFVQSTQTEDQAGFRDGEFKGLSTLAEDIQRGSLSRQREADLQDVSRLSGLYGDIMEDYKPGTASAMQGAKDLIEEQKGNLLRDVGISDPEQVAFQGVQADPLRQGLMTQAEEALGQGLTERERKLIDESQRARATMMGRTFDQTAAIEEAKAQVLEDNQRKMQNRAFAQQVLGQEAGIQTADDQRRMGGEQFNVGSKMDAERLRESLRQQGLLGYLDAASRISQIENQDQLDPFQAILGRGGGTALQQGQSVFGQAGYGLQSQPQYLRPEAGLGFIQNQATNAANMYSAQQSRAGAERAGLYSGIGSAIGGGLSAFNFGGNK